MPPALQVIDPLWQCLCPQFSPPLRLTFARKKRTFATTPCLPRPPTAFRHWRRLEVQHHTEEGAGKPIKIKRPLSVKPIPERPFPIRNQASERRQLLEDDEKTLRREALLEKTYQYLANFSNTGNYPQVQRIVERLVRVHGERPSLRIYVALLLANTDPHHGSPKEVESLLQEMETTGMIIPSQAYHAALKALAIHPDYVLRAAILEKLNQTWISLSTEGWHSVVAGLLRDQQIEMAMERIAQMQAENVSVADWLYDLLLYNLCAIGETNEGMSIVQYRQSRTADSVSPALLASLLDTAAREYNLPVVRALWRQRVQPGFMHPNAGLCLNALHTAARHGDSRLANDVFKVLKSRSTPLSIMHYEALLESYLTGGIEQHASGSAADLTAALSLASAMVASGYAPSEGSMRALYLYLSADKHKLRPIQALHILQKLHREGKPISTSTVNAVIEANIHLGSFTQAITMYKHLHMLCSKGPNTATFNSLFRGCVQASRKDLAMFLANEMVDLGIKPDAITYDRLILVCLSGRKKGADLTDMLGQQIVTSSNITSNGSEDDNKKDNPVEIVAPRQADDAGVTRQPANRDVEFLADDYEDAWKYFDEMTARGWWPRRGTLVALVHQAARKRDERVWSVLDAMEGRAMEVEGLRVTARAKWDRGR